MLFYKTRTNKPNTTEQTEYNGTWWRDWLLKISKLEDKNPDLRLASEEISEIDTPTIQQGFSKTLESHEDFFVKI